MIDVLSKPAEQIGIQDIQSLIDFEVPEGERIEYKKELAAKGNKAPDDWMTGGKTIGDRAKNEVLKEAVAFANAYGGALLLGISESETKPPVADKISSIPRCVELSDRLKMVFRDRVEPQIPRIEIFGVPVEEESGVVVIRVGGQSRLAPHRVTESLVCPIRRQDRCEPMTMREIQEMTLNVSRGLERVEKRLSERSEKFEQEFQYLSDPEMAVGIRVTAAPVGDEIWFDRVYHQGRISEKLDAPWRTVSLHGKGSKPLPLQSPARIPDTWRPMLRAARADSNSFFVNSLHNDISDPPPRHNVYQEVHCDGLVELGYLLSSDDRFAASRDIWFLPDLPIILFANLLAQVDRVRNESGYPMAEYAVEVEIYVKGNQVEVKQRQPDRHFNDVVGKFRRGSTRFPRYSLGNLDEVQNLLSLFYRDFYNVLGKDVGAEEGALKIEGWPSQEVDQGAEDLS